MRDEVATEYKEYDKHPYYQLDRTKWAGYYRPDSLPRSLPAVTALFDPKSKSKTPAQRELCLVEHHRRWLAARCTAQETDRLEPHVTTRHREETRFVAVSQEGGGACFDLVPDGGWATKLTSPDFEVLVQRHGGLHLSCLKGACDAQAAAGKTPDRHGDGEANAGEYNRRHNAALRAGREAVSAVAVGAVVLGDKGDAEKTRDLNADHTLDLAELGGDDATGRDALYEFKVPTPLTKGYAAGRGSADGGGAPASVGHLYGFGSTLEKYKRLVNGVRERGRQREGPFNHSTGRGWVKAHKGQYHDAIVVKRLRVWLMLVEAFGGLGPDTRAAVWALSERAKGRNAVDRTKYGQARASPRSYYVHHTQQIAKAAVLFDAAAIRKAALTTRQRVCFAANAAPAHGDGPA